MNRKIAIQGIKGEVFLRIKQNLMTLPGQEWQYFFYVDIKFEDYTRYEQALSAVKPLMADLTILGEYEAAI